MRPNIAIAVCFSCVISALFLRYVPGNFIREAITQFLGYDKRAITEHILAGTGIPLLLTIGFIKGWRRFELLGQWLKFCLCDIDKCKVPSWVFLAGSKVLILATFAFSIAYIIGSYNFELYQAEVAAYHFPPRGYFQDTQFYADVVGSLLSFLMAYLVARWHKKNDDGSLNKFNLHNSTISKNCMKELFFKIWKDPVWSKVISVGILASLALAWKFTSSEKLNDYLSRVNTLVEIRLWVLVVFVVLVIFYLLRSRKKSHKNTQPTLSDEDIISLVDAWWPVQKGAYYPDDVQVNFKEVEIAKGLPPGSVSKVIQVVANGKGFKPKYLGKTHATFESI